jgi:hypothetical protein
MSGISHNSRVVVGGVLLHRRKSDASDVNI